MWDVERTKTSVCAVESGRSERGAQAGVTLDIHMKASGDIFNFWRILTETKASLRKVELDSEGRLHCETGPAVIIENWKEDFKEYKVEPKWYYLQGFPVPEVVIEDPDNVTMRDIQNEENAEIRRVIIEHLGSDRFAKALDLEEIDSQFLNERQYTLLRTKTADEMARTKIQFVRVECASTDREYHLCIPIEIEDALEAVAWTFNMDKDTYNPAVET